MTKKNNKIKQSSSHVMDLKNLISGPLIATIDADSISSQRYLQYLFEIAFESYNKETGEVGALRMLTFSYMNHDVNGSRLQKVSIPLLTLVPLPLLQVKEADFDFDIKIIDAINEEREETFSFKNEEAVQEEGNTRNSTRLRVALTPSQGDGNTKQRMQQGLNSNMKVKVKMQQADIPGGLANLLHLTANNILMEEENSKENE
ncbi:DUF2589 domain-containing protein [Bacteroides sp. 224]|uniref:DUF2589 domain-containing protein n=1 Tax=Bacteroides sp. 224 TaxID=2302936 RepID=UPI0013D73437|nr:DUF2589 domain-containing protein [Bacteroides sp. 224]NDV64482.1 DUF2589 domain-containing protein [Bacteroides sp. 224]